MTDIGNMNDVHPRNKQDLGPRRSLLARAHLQGKRIELSGPRFTKVKRDGPSLRVNFSLAAGLPAAGRALAGFEVAGGNRHFVPAQAPIKGDIVVVAAAASTAPVAVRHAWHYFPDACPFNAAGLPASPFRSDRGDDAGRTPSSR